MEDLIFVDKMAIEDWDQVREIYLEGIATRNAHLSRRSTFLGGLE